MPSSRASRQSGRMAANAAVQGMMVVGEVVQASPERDSEVVKQRLLLMAREREPRPLDLTVCGQRLSMTQAAVRRILDELARSGQIEKRREGYHAGQPTTGAAQRGKHATKTDRAAPRSAPQPSGASEARWLRAAEMLFARGPMPLDRLCREAGIGITTLESLEQDALIAVSDGRVRLTLVGIDRLMTR